MLVESLVHLERALTILVVDQAGKGLPAKQPTPPVRVELARQADGTVQIRLSSAVPEVLVQRYVDRRFRLTFEILVAGRWKPLRPRVEGMYFDPMEYSPSDWVLLGYGDSLSWTLLYNMTGRLQPGDVVRLHWLPRQKWEVLPKELRAFQKRFPTDSLVTQVTVR